MNHNGEGGRIIKNERNPKMRKAALWLIPDGDSTDAAEFHHSVEVPFQQAALPQNPPHGRLLDPTPSPCPRYGPVQKKKKKKVRSAPGGGVCLIPIL